MIIGRSKREICYHGRCGHPIVHQDEESGRKYIMVRKKGGGTKRLYLKGATKYYDPEENMEEEVYAPRRRLKFIKVHYKKVYYLFRPSELKKAEKRYKDFIKKRERLRPYAENSIILR